MNESITDEIDRLRKAIGWTVSEMIAKWYVANPENENESLEDENRTVERVRKQIQRSKNKPIESISGDLASLYNFLLSEGGLSKSELFLIDDELTPLEKLQLKKATERRLRDL